MPEDVVYPFHSLSFTLIEGTRPRALFRMKRKESGMYELHVERGSAANPSSQFTREVPVATAQGLKDALQEIGVFAWDESYPDSPGAPARRWTLSTVFKKDVFSVSSKGGSDVPVGFEILLEELYKLDFPRPDASRASATSARQGIGLGTALNSMGSLGLGSIGGMSAGDLGAYGAMGKGSIGDMDFSKLGEMMQGDEMADLFGELQRNPQAFEQRMKEEFRHMSPEEQNKMLDMLASTGMASRAWWERFLRGF